MQDKPPKKALSDEEIRAKFAKRDLTPPAPKEKTIIKEFERSQIDMRGPDDPKAEPMVTGTTCILRFDDGAKLSMKSLATLFTEAAKDFPQADIAQVNIGTDRLEVSAQPTPDYKKLPPKITGSRG